MIDSTRAYAKLISAFNQNDWPRVQQRAAQLLAVAPHDPVVHFMAGVACMQTQQLPLALDYLLKATQLEPGRADFLAQYARALTLVRRMREARLVADEAMSCSPNDPMTLETLGVAYTQVNAFEQAATAFRRTVALMPGQASSRFNLAHALTAMGDNEGAEQELEKGIRLEPRYWKAHLNVAQLRQQAPTSNHLERMQSLQAPHRHHNRAQGTPPLLPRQPNATGSSKMPPVMSMPLSFRSSFRVAGGIGSAGRLSTSTFANPYDEWDALGTGWRSEGKLFQRNVGIQCPVGQIRTELGLSLIVLVRDRHALRQRLPLDGNPDLEVDTLRLASQMVGRHRGQHVAFHI